MIAMKFLQAKWRRALLRVGAMSVLVVLSSGCRTSCPVFQHLGGTQCFSGTQGPCHQSTSCYSIGDDAGYHETRWTSLQPACDWDDTIQYGYPTGEIISDEIINGEIIHGEPIEYETLHHHSGATRGDDVKQVSDVSDSLDEPRQQELEEASVEDLR